eukprot:scaffold273_cov349-Prasinococcus_capsulatus_cf.AAC.13
MKGGTYLAESLLDVADPLAQLEDARRLNRSLLVGAPHLPVERDVALHPAAPHGNRRERGDEAVLVATVPNLRLGVLGLEAIDVVKVELADRAGIRRVGVHDAVGLAGVHTGVNLLFCAHAR